MNLKRTLPLLFAASVFLGSPSVPHPDLISHLTSGPLPLSLCLPISHCAESWTPTPTFLVTLHSQQQLLLSIQTNLFLISSGPVAKSRGLKIFSSSALHCAGGPRVGESWRLLCAGQGTVPAPLGPRAGSRALGVCCLVSSPSSRLAVRSLGARGRFFT